MEEGVGGFSGANEKIAVENVSRLKRPEGTVRAEVIRRVSFHVRKGEIYAIVGPTGSGKTTLLRLLNRLEDPDDGRILLDGLDIRDMDVLQLRRRVGMVFQLPALFQATVRENILFGLLNCKKDDMDEAAAGRCLKMAGLRADMLPRDVRTLSVGQQQMVSIARALAMEPEVILMDEPTSALDPSSAMNILDLVKELNRALGLTIVFVTHQMAHAGAVAHRVMLLVNGERVEEAERDDFFHRPRHELTRRFLAGQLST